MQSHRGGLGAMISIAPWQSRLQCRCNKPQNVFISPYSLWLLSRSVPPSSASESSDLMALYKLVFNFNFNFNFTGCKYFSGGFRILETAGRRWNFV